MNPRTGTSAPLSAGGGSGGSEQVARAPFPKSQEDFDEDERVSFSKVTGRYILEAEDGAEFEFDEGLARWIPVVDDDLLEQQRQAYAVAGVDESEPAMQHQKRKRKANAGNGEQDNGAAKKPKAPGDAAPPARKNTAVYVTNLPLDATKDEVAQVFSRCGVLAEEIDSEGPRIKMYADAATGRFKGDALVVYFRPESVDIAVQILDDTDFRLGQGGGGGRMQVSVADLSYKKVQGGQEEGSAGGSGADAGYRKKPMSKDKRKIIQKTQKLNSRLADWDDDDPATLQQQSSRWDKVVVLKGMFTLKELEEDPAALLDIKEDIRDECGKLGTVTNVVLYDLEQAGVCSVRFSTPEAAQACIRMMNGRFFDGRRVEAYVSVGEKFAKSKGSKLDASDDEMGEAGEGAVEVRDEDGATGGEERVDDET